MSAAHTSTGAAEGWRAVLAEMIAGTREAVGRFPATTLFLLLAAIQASLMIEDRGIFSDEDLLLTLVAAALASLAAALFCEARQLSPWPKLAATVLAGLAAAALMWFDSAAATMRWPLLAALAGLVVTAAFIARGTSGAQWLFGVRLAFACLLALLALFLFAGGISAILASLTYLFGVEVPDELYGHVWALTGLFAAPLFGLGQVPRDLGGEPVLHPAEFADRGMRSLGDFVAAPLLLAYAAILHLYALKIVITGEVPKGQIGWLVLAYGFCVFGSLIVIHPYMRAARAPTRLVLKLWPFLLPVPLVLLFYALWLRISDYGITPERYLLALFGLVAAAIVLLQAVKRLRGDIRVMVALPVCALLLASFGPQGAVATAIRSQTDRFLEIVHAPPFDEDRNEQALSALRFLIAEDALANVKPEDFDADASENGPYRSIASAWGLDPDRVVTGNGRFLSLGGVQPAAVALGDFDLLVPEIGLYTGADEPATVPLPDGGDLSLALESDAIVATRGEETVRFVVDMEELRRAAEKATGDAPRAPRVELEAGARRIVLLPEGLNGELRPEPKLQNFSGAVLLRERDWR